MSDPRTDLEDVIEAGEKILRFTDGMSYEDFVDDEKTVDAVLRSLGGGNEKPSN